MSEKKNSIEIQEDRTSTKLGNKTSGIHARMPEIESVCGFHLNPEFYESKIWEKFKTRRKSELTQGLEDRMGFSSGNLVFDLLATIYFMVNDIKKGNIITEVAYRYILEPYNLDDFLQFPLFEGNEEDHEFQIDETSSKEKKMLSQFMHEKLGEAINDMIRLHLESHICQDPVKYQKSMIIRALPLQDNAHMDFMLVELLKKTASYIADYQNQGSTSCFDQEHQNQIQKLQEQIQVLEKEKQEQFVQLQKYKLQEEIFNGIEDADLVSGKKNKEYQKEIRQLYHEKSKLKRQLEEKEEKNRALTESLQDYETLLHMKQEIETQEPDIFDYQGRYLIVGGSESLFQRIQAILPNAEHAFEERYKVIPSVINSYDAVIYLTTYMSHTIYYNVKNALYKDRIQMHSTKKNASLIIQELRDYINGQQKMKVSA